MPGYWINGGAVAGSLNFYSQTTINDEERSPTLARLSSNFNYQKRCCTDYRISRAFSGWTWGSGSFIDPDGTNGMDPILGNDNLDNHSSYEPWLLGLKGTTRPYYIAGVVYDATNTPVAGATVESFITATDVKDGETVSGDTGTYQVPCYNRTATHYVNAYKTGSPDAAGESANTLTPTLTGN